MEIRGLIVSIVLLGVAAIVTGTVVIPMIAGVNTDDWKDNVTNIWDNLPVFFVLALMLGIVGLFTFLIA